MAGYTPLFPSIITSSIWNEDNAVRIVWITLLAMADADGNVEASVVGLAPVARVSIPECRKAIKVLTSPDPDSRTQELEGRRIIPIDGGWQLVNHRKYREKAKSRAAYFRNYRVQQKEKKSDIKEKKTNSYSYSNNATARNSAQRCASDPKKKGKRKKFSPPTLQEVANYIQKNNYKVDAKKFIKYYSESDPPWHDQTGKPVRSWKQKLIAVWVKPNGQDQLPFDASAARQRAAMRKK